MNYRQFMNAGMALNELATIKGCDPATKIKLFKIRKWATAEQEVFKELVDNLHETVRLPETLILDNTGHLKSGSEEEFKEYLDIFKPEEEKVLNLEIDCKAPTLTLDELSTIKEISVSTIEILDDIGLIEEEE